MFLRILKSSLVKRYRTVLLTLLSITLGASVATAFLGLAGEISYKMALELRKYGANILVEPLSADLTGGGYLKDSDLPRIKTVFWKYNITGFAPFLYQSVDLFGPAGHSRAVVAGTWFSKRLEIAGEMPTIQGVQAIAPWWQVSGRYPAAADDAVVGASLARRLGVAPGGLLTVAYKGKTLPLRVTGVVTTGGVEEEQLFAPLATVQEFLEMAGKVSRVLVSALTVPMDAFGRKDPATMNTLEYEKWYCTAYVTSVAKNMEEALTGSRAKPVWQIAGAEGDILRRLNTAMLLLAILALVAATVSVSSGLTASMAERRKEIALMKAIGADRSQITFLFLGETIILALTGGMLGFLIGGRLAEYISHAVFNSALVSPAWLFPTALASALLVSLAGAIGPLRQVLAVETVKGLKG